MEINYQAMIIGGGAFYGFLISISLFLNRTGNESAKKIMATLVMIYCLCMVNYMVFLTGNIFQLAGFAGNTFPLFFLVGPLLYLYTKSLNSYEFQYRHKYLILFLPYIVWQVYFLPTYFFEKFEKLRFLSEFVTIEMFSLSFWFAFSNILCNLFFIIISLHEINIFRKSVDIVYSNETIARTQWTQHLISAILVITVYNLITLSLNVAGYELFAASEFIGTLLFLLLIIGVGVHTLNQPHIYTKLHIKKNTTEEDDLSYLVIRIEKYMNTSKRFLDPNLRLDQLANELNVSSHKLSAAINKGFGKNFFEFTNEYRVDHAKRLLKNENNMKLFSVAIDSGFNTQASFNRTFKRHEGTSPSTFRARVQS